MGIGNRWACLLDLMQHKARVSAAIRQITAELDRRASLHDISKLDRDKFECFAGLLNDLRGKTFGKDDYSKVVQKHPCAQRHVASEKHHLKDHMRDMTLIDVLEMLADWKAASEREHGTSLEESLPILFNECNIENVSVIALIIKTLEQLGWIEKSMTTRSFNEDRRARSSAG